MPPGDAGPADGYTADGDPADGYRAAYDRDLLVSRYGPRRADDLLALVTGRPAPRQRTRAAVVVTVLALAVVLTWVVWAWRSANTGAVTGQLVGFAPATSDTSLVVTWNVSRDPETTVSCHVTVTDRSGAKVGDLTAVVLPRGDRTTRVVTDVRTTARAVDASVGGCRTVPTTRATRAPAAG